MTGNALVVRLRVTSAMAEVAADELWGEGATAIEVVDEGADTLLVAGFPTPEAARVVAARLRAARSGAELAEIDPGSWEDAWRAYARPMPVGPALIVAPAWRPVPVYPGRLVLEIDPGPCFGSGSHASTRAILLRLADAPPRDQVVLDVGTGSGILAVAAARLGARFVQAIDIDPEAIPITVANAARNRVTDRVHASTTRLTDVVGTAADARAFDVALVNVTAGVHAEVAPEVVAAVVSGGRLILAGLLPGQWQHVAAGYRHCDVVDQAELDGWESLELRRH